jgi:hypothetical protein
MIRLVLKFAESGLRVLNRNRVGADLDVIFPVDDDDDL